MKRLSERVLFVLFVRAIDDTEYISFSKTFFLFHDKNIPYEELTND